MKKTIWYSYLGFMAIAFILSLGFIVTSFVPNNPLQPKRVTIRQVASLIPQGWAFFTKDPQEAELVTYRASAEDQYRPVMVRNERSWMTFNFSRYGRFQAREYGFIAESIPKDLWIECKKDFEKCVKESKTYQYHNRTVIRSFCGSYLFSMEPPVPWAWSKREVFMPRKIVKVHSVCEGEQS